MSFSCERRRAPGRDPALGGRELASAPSGNVRPTTDACCTSRRSKASSESSRAASTACTVSGSSAASMLPSSEIRRAISSANSGLPPERSATAGTTSSPSGSNARTSARLCSSLSGSRNSWVAERRPPPQPRRRSSSSSRARQTSMSGAAHPLCQVLDRVEQAVVGPVDVLERDHERVPVGDRLDPRAQRREERTRAAARGRPRPAPARAARPRRAAARSAPPRGPSGSRPTPPISSPSVRAQLAPGLLRGVRLDDPALLAQHLAERPEDDAASVRQAAAGAHGRRWTGARESRASNSRSRRDLPTPASPTTVTRWEVPSRTTRS